MLTPLTVATGVLSFFAGLAVILLTCGGKKKKDAKTAAKTGGEETGNFAGGMSGNRNENPSVDSKEPPKEPDVKDPKGKNSAYDTLVTAETNVVIPDNKHIEREEVARALLGNKSRCMQDIGASAHKEPHAGLNTETATVK